MLVAIEGIDLTDKVAGGAITLVQIAILAAGAYVVRAVQKAIKESLGGNQITALTTALNANTAETQALKGQMLSLGGDLTRLHERMDDHEADRYLHNEPPRPPRRRAPAR